ncbi:MAG: hypothetical protein ACP5E3_20370 [Bacteroidales bacterium]
MEKPEALTTLLRNERFYVNHCLSEYLPGQSELASGGQSVLFFQIGQDYL